MRNYLRAGGIGLALLGLFAASASADAGARSFVQVYPVASGLCAKATAGTLPKGLAPSKQQVLAACTTLQGGYTQLTATVTAAETTFASERASEQAKVQAVCPPSSNTAAGRETCRTTRLTARVAISEALLTRHDAVVTYFTSLEANRVAFWSTIHALRGGSRIKGDPPVTQPSPAQNPS
jgi:hypothetical protein